MKNHFDEVIFQSLRNEDSMAKAARGLGKGLDSLIPVAAPQAETKAAEPKKEDGAQGTYVKITKVEPNREQPRKNFDEDALQELADSIKQYGIVEPLIVQDRKTYYEIIAGERRWRAAKLAGLKEVPVIVRNYTEQEIVEISLIENIQREDLNPIEEALAYKRLLTEFNLKQDEVAERVSKSRTAVTNSMRLLKLNEKVQQMLIDDMLSTGHARALLAIEDEDEQYNLAQKIFDEKMSVRDVEKLVKKLQKEKTEKPKEQERTDQSTEQMQAIYHDLEERMKRIFGTKVCITSKDMKKGKIEIEYYSPDELDHIVEMFQNIQNGSF